jgi:hypothetical protein
LFFCVYLLIVLCKRKLYLADKKEEGNYSKLYLAFVSSKAARESSPACLPTTAPPCRSLPSPQFPPSPTPHPARVAAAIPADLTARGCTPGSPLRRRRPLLLCSGDSPRYASPLSDFRSSGPAMIFPPPELHRVAHPRCPESFSPSAISSKNCFFSGSGFRFQLLLKLWAD